MEKRIYLSPPHLSGSEKKYVNQAFDTNWIAPLGPNVDGFEDELSRYTGAKYVAALTTGTAAIHLALIMLGVKQGDEVLASSFTFSASANPIVYVGATPIFIDSEKDTWNMSPDLLETAIKDRLKHGKKPKAIILVHLYGMPAKIDEIMQIASKYDIPVIEDAAEALGAKYKGKQVGTFGQMGVLSFNGNKIITTSGGGALMSNKKEFIDKAKFLSTQARDDAPHYQHTEIGYNYRMSNLLAGVGRGQLEVIDERVNQCRKNHAFYSRYFADKKGIEILTEAEGFYSNYWLTTVTIDSKKTGFANDELRIHLEKHNIESRPLWKPMHLQPVFIKYPAYTNGLSERLFNCGLCLPSGTNMTLEDKNRIKNALDLIFSTQKQ